MTDLTDKELSEAVEGAQVAILSNLPLPYSHEAADDFLMGVAKDMARAGKLAFDGFHFRQGETVAEGCTSDEERAVALLNARLGQWFNVGQRAFAEMLGISEAELLELIPQGVPYHAHPTSRYGEYRFHATSLFEVRRRIECIKGSGHDYAFDRYYDDRKWPVMKCRHCGVEDYLREPYPAAAPAQSPVDASGPATWPQRDYLRQLNAWHAPDITKTAASALITRAKLNRKIVSPILYAAKPIRACCELCGVERPVEDMAAGSGGYDWDNPDPDFQGSVGLLSYRCADGSGCRANRSDAAEAARLDAEAAEVARYDDNSPGKIGL